MIKSGNHLRELMLILWAICGSVCLADEKVDGYYIMKNGDTVLTIFKVPTVLNVVNYSKLQKSIYYYENGVLNTINPSVVKKVHFSFKQEVFNFIPVFAKSNFIDISEKELFLRVYQEGKPMVLEYYFGNSLFGLTTNCSNDNSAQKSIYLIYLMNGELISFHKNFHKAVELLFVNCPGAIKEVDRQQLDCLDVINIATLYNVLCKH